MKQIMLTVMMLLVVKSAYADLDDLKGQYQTELEELSSASNQRVYDDLKASGCDDFQESDSRTCSGSKLSVWRNVRALVHTANYITNSLNNGDGPTGFRLGIDSDRDGVDLEELGFALRWTAGEEFAAQESMLNNFVNGQLSGVAGRITAIRHGSRGFALGGVSSNPEILIAAEQLNGARGGAAGADDGNQWSRWGGFINGSYAYGDKKATELEDAFDFDGREITMGLDYRIDNQWTVGVMLGYQEEELDFDSSRSVVDGAVDMNGFNLMPFAMLQADRWYISFALGFQVLEFDMERSIRFLSTDTVAKSSPDADVISAFATAGYSFSFFSADSLEPYFSLDYRDIKIDKYQERDIKNTGFDFVVSDQSIRSRESILGLRYQYALTPAFGVFVPYIDAQYHKDTAGKSRDIEAFYVGASSSLSSAAAFRLPTDAPDDQYEVYTIGLNMVLRGSSQSTTDAVAAGGLQGFINYRTFRNMKNYDQEIIAFGLRYEF